MSDTPRSDAAHGTGRFANCVDVDFARELEREIAAKQAEIDRLMLEYCPDEMTPEQIENWKRHQRRTTPEEETAVEAALRATDRGAKDG